MARIKEIEEKMLGQAFTIPLSRPDFHFFDWLTTIGQAVQRNKSRGPVNAVGP